MEETIPHRLTENPELLKEINAVIVFEITGGSGGRWTLDTTKGSGWVTAGADGVTPKMTVTASDVDFVAVCTRKLSAEMATLQRKLQFHPFDMGLAMKLKKLLV
jgi:hypothetical protein